MVYTKFGLAAFGTALFLVVGQTAEAAKGVQKPNAANNPAVVGGNVNPAGIPAAVAGNAQHTVTGVVLSINQHPKNGGVTFHVRTAYHHKKRGTVNAGGTATGIAGGNHHHHGHEFHVTAATRFEHFNGSPASVANLRRGERVRVLAAGHQALNVHILSHHNPRVNFARHRVHTYRAMPVQQRMIHPVYRHPRRK
jgi:hypothetical protein